MLPYHALVPYSPPPFDPLHLVPHAQAHADLEAQKPPGQRCPAGPYLYFTPYDMCDAAKAHGGQPPVDYLDCVWDQTPPKEYARPRDYDLRWGFDVCVL